VCRREIWHERFAAEKSWSPSTDILLAGGSVLAFYGETVGLSAGVAERDNVLRIA
jgi:hypothetical protein